MSKIKLHTVQMHDTVYLDIVYDQIDIIVHDNIIECFDHELVLLNRNWFLMNIKHIEEYLKNSIKNRLILLDVKEGTNTVLYNLIENNLLNYFVKTKQIMVISSGDFSEDTKFVNINYLINDSGFTYNTAISLNQFEKIYNTKSKPYKFLFLNNNPRKHRKWLISKLQELNLLNSSLWSDLSANITVSTDCNDFYNGKMSNVFINNTEHDCSVLNREYLLVPDLYINTYFSIVTETNYEFPYSFLTEKIYKPILMGHPFIAVSNYKFYQTLKDRGYKTFEPYIDESFDNIKNNEDRLVAIADSINQLCQKDLDYFLAQTKYICEHNRRNFFREIGDQYLIRYNALKIFFDEIY